MGCGQYCYEPSARGKSLQEQLIVVTTTSMDLNLVRTFVFVAEAGSFTTAAKQLGVPTSSISRAVARLEEALQAKLLDRTTRRTALSAAGRMYLEFARQALDALTEGESRMSELLGQPRGEVRISVPINLDDGFFARQLVAFSRTYPQVRLSVEPSNRWVDMNEEAVDLALRVQQKSSDLPPSMLKLGEFFAWLVATPAYLKARGRPRFPRDLTNHVCVNMQSQRVTLRLIGALGAEAVEVGGPIVANDMNLALQLVEQGAGIGALVFPPGARRDLGKSFVRVLPDYIVEGPSLFVVTPQRKNQPLRVKLLRQFLIDAYVAEAARLLC
jgi:DNA-binding transcriptional LysR family regulator